MTALSSWVWQFCLVQQPLFGFGPPQPRALAVFITPSSRMFPELEGEVMRVVYMKFTNTDWLWVSVLSTIQVTVMHIDAQIIQSLPREILWSLSPAQPSGSLRAWLTSEKTSLSGDQPSGTSPRTSFFVEIDTAKPQSGSNRPQQSLPRFLGWTSWDLGHGHLLPKSKTDTDKDFATKRKIPLCVKDFAIVSQFRSVVFHLAYILESPREVFINTDAQIYSKFFV